jgi:hypothetical protein
MTLESSTYHKVLRIAAIVCAFVLVFQSGVVSETTAELSRGTHEYLANAVSLSARVEPTELNQYTAALSVKERELEAREALVAQREIEVGIGSGGARNDYETFILAAVLFVILVLLVLNYALDYIRARDEQMELSHE